VRQRDRESEREGEKRTEVGSRPYQMPMYTFKFVADMLLKVHSYCFQFCVLAGA
jgi:hypothetical protein